MLFVRFGQRLGMAAVCVAVLGCTVSVARAEQLPGSLRGTWRITRILPTTNSGCWTREQAQSLVGTTLTYGQSSMRWRGGVVPVEDIYTRVVSAEDFSKENAGAKPASFAQLGVRAAELVEVDMQHEDAAVLPASTEVPGDSVLMVAPARIVVSACGVYYEATRSGRVSSGVRSVGAKRARDGVARATGR